MQRKKLEGDFKIRTDSLQQADLVLPPIALFPFGKSPLLQFSLVRAREEAPEKGEQQEAMYSKQP